MRFCIVGLANTTVDIAAYFFLTRVLGFDMIVAAKACAYLLATLFSFTVNRYWTFGRRDVVRLAEVGRFYSTVGLGIFVNTGVMYVVARIIGLPDLFGVVIAAGATAVWGFAFSRWYVFKPTS
jgi:putative flippase GtrA